MSAVHELRFDVPETAVDENGHVNNVAYVNWMQDVAVEHSAVCGWPAERYMKLGRSWFVRRHTVEYLRPAFADQPMRVMTWVSRAGSRSSDRSYLFVHGTTDVVHAWAHTVWVWIDLTSGRPARLPKEIFEDFVVIDADRARDEIGLDLPQAMHAG